MKNGNCIICNRFLGFEISDDEVIFCLRCEEKIPKYLEEHKNVHADGKGYYWIQKL